MNMRQFAAIVGILFIIGAGIALFTEVEAGDWSMRCGTAVAPDTDRLSNEPLEECEDALGTRRVWGWPVGVAGLIVLGGAVVAESQAKRPAAS